MNTASRHIFLPLRMPQPLGRLQCCELSLLQARDVIDILVQPRRDQSAAERFFRKLRHGQGEAPFQIITGRAQKLLGRHANNLWRGAHNTERYANHRAEVSHQPTRQRERQMRRFKSAGQAQRFLFLHSVVQNLFRVGRHLLKATNHRLLRSRSFAIWQTGTAA